MTIQQFLLVFVCVISLVKCQSCIVSTSLGSIQGVSQHNGVNAFLGVPYAQPPIGDLRWKPPQPASSWSGVLDATAFGYTCPQLQSPLLTVSYPNQSESCLTLNIWTPASGICQSTTGQNLPVMFFVQGGGFMVGSSSDPVYNGANLAAEKSVIVVTFNYRLGAFGFLATEDLALEDANNSTGNYGFNDQQEALRWVQAHISSFGGDPTMVTLFGQSAGGNSVLAHLASPLSKNLFSAAISESGFYRGVYGLDSALTEGEYFIQNSTCTGSGSQLLECMRSLTIEQILAIQAPCLWLPTIDGYVLTDFPNNVVESGMFNNVSVIIGGTRDEGTLTAIALYNASEVLVPYFLSAFGFSQDDITMILKAYPLQDYPSVYYQAAAIFGDWNIKCSSRRFAALLSKQGVPTYLFQFSYPPQNNGYYNTPLFLGAYHAAEVPFVFGTGDFSHIEYDLSTSISSYWTNLGIYGNPNGKSGGIEWPLYNSTADVNIDFDLINELQVGLDIQPLCDFWDTLSEYVPAPACIPAQRI